MSEPPTQDRSPEPTPAHPWSYRELREPLSTRASTLFAAGAILFGLVGIAFAAIGMTFPAEPAGDAFAWRRLMHIAATVAGVLTLALAVAGFIRREDRRLVVLGASLAVATLLWPWFVVVAITLLVVIVLAALLGLLG